MDAEVNESTGHSFIDGVTLPANNFAYLLCNTFIS